ncbi:plastocyanin/azurin family copper-binding protein [Rhodococcus triatomae]
MGRRWTIPGAVAVTLLAGCSGEEEPDAVIEIADVQFGPPDVTVPVGGTVEWRFDDGGVLHHVESDPTIVVEDEFDSGITGVGTFRHTFDRAGTYTYTCSVHRYMTGTVTVE